MRWLALAVFAWLAILVGRGQAVFFDEPVREAVHRHASPLWTTILRAFTFIGEPGVFWPAVVIIVALGWRNHRASAIRLGVVMAGAAVLEIGIKLAFHRARPEAFFGASPKSYSFPSGHALYAACLYGALASLAAASIAKRFIWLVAMWTAAGLMIVLIGFSRIYLGVHYPSDVLAGWSIGWFWMRSVLVFKA
ncbi:MAG TPA: phosphatase PAP2 family protein [Bryobacteraceae bacterium]|nr:phosphatase PAP2 family protein [Bryobacteraceae bacterium]